MDKHIHLTQKDVDKINKKLPSIEKTEALANLFKVFSDKTRVKILLTLVGNHLCVHDISLALDMSHSAISHQLRTLREANLVKFKKSGKEVVYSFSNKEIEDIFKQGLTYLENSK
ncbi:MAG TPA: metalloregulator ArsR/SmtB family transcription factor [Erysipelotrichaceae bacterium]|nr:metalloregulator ArsR/SmtB family transcription factor [Erysipelotrichaceae bacterium]